MQTDVSAVIVAAGSGNRMKKMFDGEKQINKVYRQINGVSILAHTVNAFEKCKDIKNIVIVTRSCDIAEAKSICDEFGFGKVSVICEGGDTRSESVLKGLSCLSGSGIVLIHDGARCLITPDIISDVYNAVLKYGAASAGVKTKDSLKRVSDGFIAETVERAGMYNVQTPQGFYLNEIIAAYKSAARSEKAFTDDCAVAEMSGIKIKMVDASYTNIKITTEDDIIFAKAVMEGEK